MVQKLAGQKARNMATRKSTPKWEVVGFCGTVCVSGISKTEATKIARAMSRGSKSKIIAQPVKRGILSSPCDGVDASHIHEAL